MYAVPDGGGDGTGYAGRTQREVLATIASVDTSALDAAETLWRDTAAQLREIHDEVQLRLRALTGPGGWTGDGADAFRHVIEHDVVATTDAFADDADSNAKALAPVNGRVVQSAVTAIMNDIPWDVDAQWRVDREQQQQSLWGKVDEVVTGDDDGLIERQQNADYLVHDGGNGVRARRTKPEWETIQQINPVVAPPSIFAQTNTPVTAGVHHFDRVMESMDLNANPRENVRASAQSVDDALAAYAPRVAEPVHFVDNDVTGDEGVRRGVGQSYDFGPAAHSGPAPTAPSGDGGALGRPGPTGPGSIPLAGPAEGHGTPPRFDVGPGVDGHGGGGAADGSRWTGPDGAVGSGGHGGPGMGGPGGAGGPGAGGPGAGGLGGADGLGGAGGADRFGGPAGPGAADDPSRVPGWQVDTSKMPLEDPGTNAAGLDGGAGGRGLGPSGHSLGSGAGGLGVGPSGVGTGGVGTGGAGAGPGGLGAPPVGGGLGGPGSTSGPSGTSGPGGTGAAGRIPGADFTSGRGTIGGSPAARSGASFHMGPGGRGVVNPGNVGPMVGVPAVGRNGRDDESGPGSESWLEEDQDVWTYSDAQHTGDI